MGWKRFLQWRWWLRRRAELLPEVDDGPAVLQVVSFEDGIYREVMRGTIEELRDRAVWPERYPG